MLQKNREQEKEQGLVVVMKDMLVLSGCKYSVNMMTERSFLNLHFECKWFGELCAVVFGSLLKHGVSEKRMQEGRA
jgi:hypothetical protein